MNIWPSLRLLYNLRKYDGDPCSGTNAFFEILVRIRKSHTSIDPPTVDKLFRNLTNLTKPFSRFSQTRKLKFRISQYRKVQTNITKPFAGKVTFTFHRKQKRKGFQLICFEIPSPLFYFLFIRTFHLLFRLSFEKS